MEKKIKQFCYIQKKKILGKGKKNQTFLLHFEKKILGIEKKIKRLKYVTVRKTSHGLRALIFFKKSNNFGY